MEREQRAQTALVERRLDTGRPSASSAKQENIALLVLRTVRCATLGRHLPTSQQLARIALLAALMLSRVRQMQIATYVSLESTAWRDRACAQIAPLGSTQRTKPRGA